MSVILTNLFDFCFFRNVTGVHVKFFFLCFYKNCLFSFILQYISFSKFVPCVKISLTKRNILFHFVALKI